MMLQWYRWPDGTRLRHEYNGVVIPAHRTIDGNTGDRGMNYYAAQIQAAHGAEIAEMKSECERMRKLAEKNEAAADALWAERDRLREALDHAMKGDMDPEDRVVIEQILAGVGEEVEG